MSRIVRGIVGAAAIVVAVIFPPTAPFLLPLGTSLLLGAVLEKKPGSIDQLRSQSVMVRSAVQPQEILFGRDKKSGVVAYFDTSGSTNEFLWFVVAVVEHEIDGYEKLWMDSTAVDIATEIDVDGFVTNAKFIDADGNKLVKTKFYTGLDSQVADPELVAAFADWTIDHKGQGVAYFWVRLELDKSDGGNDPENPSANVWAKGYPRDIAVTARGVKVYDPRLDSTNGGTGLHRLADPTTWEWSENSVLCRAYYAMSARFGPGYTSSEIDWSVVIAQANIADELVSIPGSTTQKRYTLNGVVSTDGDPKAIIESMQSADHGVTLFLPSGIEIRAGAWSASSHTIDESWIAGPYSATSATPTDDAYNAIRGQYVSAAADYTIIEFQPRLAPAFETEDGVGRVWTDVVLPFTREEFAAQRLAIIELKKSRQQANIQIQCNYRGELVQPYQIVTVNLPGYVNKTFRVLGKSQSTDGTTSLQLREELESDWTFTIPDLATPPIIPSVLRNPDGVTAPTALAAITAGGGINVVWAHPNLTAISHVEVYSADTNLRSGATLQTEVKGLEWFDFKDEGTIKYYWVIARGLNGMLSQWYPLSDTGGIQGTAGVVGSGANAVSGSLDNERATVPAESDGTGFDLASAGGTFHVWDGTADVTGAGPAYSVLAPATVDGLTLSIDAATGIYSLDGVAWSGVAASFVLRAIYIGVTIDKIYTIVKALGGVNAKFLNVDSSTQSFAYDADGVLKSAPTITFTADQHGSTATINWVTQIWDGVGWINTTTNRLELPHTGTVVTLQEAKFSAEGAQAMRVHAAFEDPPAQFSIDNVTITRLQDGAVGPTGTGGLSVAELNIFQRTDPAPATPTGGSFDFGTQILTPPASWSDQIPGGNDPLYASRAVASIVGASGIDNTLTWTLPAKVAQDGESVDIVFQRSATQPATPAPSFGVPSGWFSDVDSVPLTTDPIWSSVGTRPNAGKTWTWMLPLLVEGSDATFFYIKPTNGTAIKNGTGTLTVEAHQVTGAADVLLSSGTIQLFVGTTLVTAANGFVVGSDGYTGIFDSGDITGDVVVTLKDGAAGAPLDTITLVDVADGLAGGAGADAVYGFIEPSGSLSWTRASDQATWTPVGNTVDLDVTFVQGGVTVARDAMRITRSSAGILTSSATTHPLGDLNTSRITITTIGSSSQSITIKYNYSFGGATASVAETVITSMAGSDGATGATGPAGSNQATVFLYQRTNSGTAPAVPSTSKTYTFATGLLTSAAPWTQSVPAASSSLPFLWVTTAVAVGTGTTDSISPSEWATPVIQNQDGIQTRAVFIYKRTTTSTPPAKPTTASATYTFSTGVLSAVNNGWTQPIPSTGGGFLWVSQATALASALATTDAIAAAEWSDAVLLSKDGVDAGGGSTLVRINTNGESAAALSPANATILWQLDSTGNEQRKKNTDPLQTIATWLLSGAASAYSCRAIAVSGTFASGTFGSWLNLGTTRAWTVTDTTTTGGPVTGTMTVDIRLDSTGEVEVTKTFTLDAEKII